MYRTFCNVETDSNLAIHCLLLQIQSRLQRDGALPPTLFLQVDGGAENTNKTLLAMLELLVSQGLFKKVFLSRLPVGHTHEGTLVATVHIS